MPSAPANPAITGEEINATHLLALAQYLNEYWAGTAYAFDTSHQTDLTRRYGWGQALASVNTLANSGTAIATGSVALTGHMNQIIAQVNTSVDHQTDHLDASNNIVSPFVDKRAVGDKIDAVLFNDSLNEITKLGVNSYLVADLDLTPSVETTTSLVSDAWQNDLTTEHKFIFANYNAARHFFNSGGELTLLLSMAADANAANAMWKDIFEQFDSIRIGAETCRVVNDPTNYNVISSSAVSKGFYTGIKHDGTYTTVLDASGGINNTYAYAYLYAYGEYSSRRIRIELKAIDGATFDIYVKVTLLETDPVENTTITKPITLELGHAQPATTPLQGDADVNYYTVDSHLFQFVAPNVPTITRISTWADIVAP
jgi:hypothetical protein